jgi:hypothetical protein
MPNMGGVEIVAPNGDYFFYQKWHETLIKNLYASTEYLGAMEQFNVAARTPVLTGALQASISYDSNHDENNELLAFIYADEGEQEAQWGRVYDVYQEGGALGLATYTNPPREMFAHMFDDDIPAIEKWGMDACQEGLDELARGEGLL